VTIGPSINLPAALVQASWPAWPDPVMFLRDNVWIAGAQSRQIKLNRAMDDRGASVRPYRSINITDVARRLDVFRGLA